MVAEDVLNATVIYRHDLHEELSIVRVRPDSGVVPEFVAGQFAMLALPRDDSMLSAAAANRDAKARPRMIRRAYSIASSPKVRDYLEFYVVLVQGGKLTPKLWTVAEGGRLWLDDRIKGEFTLDGVPEGRDLVMMSTGTGIAPFMSMLRTYRGTPRYRRLVMIHGVRLVEDLGYREELEQIAAEDDNVIYIPICSREPDDSPWQGRRGRVQTLLVPDVYASLEGRGFTTHSRKQPGDIHFERYW
jgi:ferredoxin--NADP+ reductase